MVDVDGVGVDGVGVDGLCSVFAVDASAATTELAFSCRVAVEIIRCCQAMAL